VIDLLLAEEILPALLAKQATTEQLERVEEIVLAAGDVVAKVIIALSNNSTSHTRFRSLLNHAGCRFASLPHFDPEMFFTSMRVDWHLLSERTRSLAERINRAVGIRVETGNGTRMHFGKKGRTAAGDDGLPTAPKFWQSPWVGGVPGSAEGPGRDNGPGACPMRKPSTPRS
jgi:leucyl aminopeptidase (aminopeptidase T)